MINKQLIKKIVFLLMASLSLLLVTVTHAAAQQLPFYWDNINVIIDVQTNGDMLVTETEKYVFTADYTYERYRYIPLDKVDEIKDVTVTENNQIIPSSTGTENNQLWIRWQHELKPPDSHTSVIKYRVVGGLQQDGENTLVYWKAIAAGRKAPINSGKVTVKLPEALSGKVLSFTNFGAAAVPRQVDPKTFEFVASQAIPPEQELEVQIAFPQAILNIPQPGWQQTGNQSQSTSGGADLFFFLISPLLIILLPLAVITFPIWIGVLYLILVTIYIYLITFCFRCKKFTLDKNRQVISTATPKTKGKDKVIYHCTNCGYHHEKIVITRYVDPSSFVSNGGGGGG
jgi:hypothetical protein